MASGSVHELGPFLFLSVLCCVASAPAPPQPFFCASVTNELRRKLSLWLNTPCVNFTSSFSPFRHVGQRKAFSKMNPLPLRPPPPIPCASPNAFFFDNGVPTSAIANASFTFDFAFVIAVVVAAAIALAFLVALSIFSFVLSFSFALVLALAFHSLNLHNFAHRS